VRGDRSVAADRGAAADRYVEIQTAPVDRYVAADHSAEVDRDALAARSVVTPNAEVPSVARNAHVAPNVVRRVGAQAQVVVPPGAQAAVPACFREQPVVQAPRYEVAARFAARSRLRVDPVRVSPLPQA
jgi:hypothetical protein